MKSIKTIFVAALFLYSCAKVGVISGGDKDDAKPKLISVYPDSGTVNFKDNQVFFEFDEFVSVDNPSKTIKIIPRLTSEPKIVTKKNIVQVSNLTLAPETTYTIILSKAIKDITEKNVSEKFSMQFSTGPFMDTLKIRGRIVDIEGTGVENINVYLLQGEDSLSPTTLVNESLTEGDGEFIITGLKPGKYMVVVLDDKNNNVLYDLPKEKIGFTESFHITDTTNVFLNIIMFATDERKLELLTVRERKDYTEFVTNKNIAGVHTDSIHFHVIEKNKPNTIKVYPINGKTVDIIPISITDSLKDRLDTLYIRGQKLEPLESTDTLDYKSIGMIRKKDHLLLRLETIYPLNFSESALWLKSYSLKLDSFACNLTHGAANTVDCMIPYPGLLENDTLDLSISGTIFDLRGNIYRDTALSIDLKELSQYGSIGIAYPTIKGFSIIPFLSTKNNAFIYCDSYTDTTALFSGLNSGDYSIKLIIDRNKDGKLSSGSYLRLIQPESIYVHPELIKLKANWDVDKVRIPVELVLTYMDKLKQIVETPNQDGLDIDNSEDSNEK